MIKKRLFYLCWLTITVIVFLEVLIRVYFSTHVGPRVLFYGSSSYRNEFGDQREKHLGTVYDKELAVWDKDKATINTVYTHDNIQGGYLKFFPYEKKFHKDVDTGEVFPVTINSRGFRGKEFTAQKPHDVIRILTLGASSTVGLWSRDHETYPVQLEKMLNERTKGPKRYEVINFAIPHAVSDQILSMFMTEGLALKPDIITFYEGRNDSYRVHPMDFHSGVQNISDDEKDRRSIVDIAQKVTQRLVVARLIDELLTNRIKLSAEMTTKTLELVGSRTSKDFLLDLEQIRELAEERGILFIVISQQANSKSWFGLPENERMKLKGVTYQDEVRQIRRLIDMGESISGYEFNFLIHDRLMRDLEAWAHQNNLPYIDFIELLDQNRNLLVSWVHLHPEGNKLLANAIADKILNLSSQQLQAQR